MNDQRNNRRQAGDVGPTPRRQAGDGGPATHGKARYSGSAPHGQAHYRTTSREHAKRATTSKKVSERGSRQYYTPNATYGKPGQVGRIDYSRENPRYKGVKRRRRQNRAPVVIASALVAALVVGGTVMWNTRPVDIKLNGRDARARIGATLVDAQRDNDLSVRPGNYVSVSGKVLREGEGTPLSARVDGSDLSAADVEKYRIKGGETIEISDGKDRVEEYTATETRTQPKLRMDGDGTALAYVSQWGREGVTERRTGKETGETADVVTQETQDCIVYLRNVSPDDDRKVVALTFDDGPSTYTQRYLDILSSAGAKATFFCLGQMIDKYPDLAKAIVDQGSQIASHTYAHQRLSKLDAETLQSEHGESFQRIRDAAGVSTTVFRPPYGEYNESCWLRSAGLASVSVLWTQDSRDWARPGADEIVTNSLVNIKPGSIVLMHDGGGDRDQDLEALPKIIKALKDQGFEFVTIDELMQSDSTIPKDIATGNATIPDDAVWPTEIGD
ncbi:MAG: polysaccharide deacetylase family protein [Olsenella sp.]|nr:polysaccharide deacetylase family protein [Olsenella sp.]